VLIGMFLVTGRLKVNLFLLTVQWLHGNVYLMIFWWKRL